MAKYTAVISLDDQHKPYVISKDTVEELLPALMDFFMKDDGRVTLLEDGTEIPFPTITPALVADVGGKALIITYPNAKSVVASDGSFSIPQ